jgi:hypothetical protein
VPAGVGDVENLKSVSETTENETVWVPMKTRWVDAKPVPVSAMVEPPASVTVVGELVDKVGTGKYVNAL